MAARPETRFRPLTRRHLLGTLSGSAVLAGSGFFAAARAQDTTPAPAAPAPEATTPPAATATDTGAPFSFDALSEEMRHAADQAPQVHKVPDSFLSQLDYDAYKLIRFNPEDARFADIKNTRFELQAFHMGWLFKEPVLLYEVADGKAKLMAFSTDDFTYERQARDIVPEHAPLPGVAGFRLHTPLNRPDIYDELVAFQGASYFRALGRGSAYGLSARGLAINTGSSVAEEFPRFTRFWVTRPEPAINTITVWAAMESASLTGAYQFVITPGAETKMEVTARLYIRNDIAQLGIAPLTSMYLFGSRNRANFDDYRPNVHDSDGLGVKRDDGDILWRPLSNPAKLSSSYFVEKAPRSFGLYQRDRNYADYQDAEALYERRPSCRVEPTSDWGNGTIRLVEIPSQYEVNDNIVAFWVPEKPAKAGDMLEVSYRLSWGDLPPDPRDDRAHVIHSSAGVGGVSGVPNNDGTHKFVIDFAGGLIADLPEEEGSKLSIVATATKAQIVTQVLHHVPENNVWRMVLDVKPEKGAIVELSAHIAGCDRKLTETWLYQWMSS